MRFSCVALVLRCRCCCWRSLRQASVSGSNPHWQSLPEGAASPWTRPLSRGSRARSQRSRATTSPHARRTCAWAPTGSRTAGYGRGPTTARWKREATCPASEVLVRIGRRAFRPCQHRRCSSRSGTRWACSSSWAAARPLRSASRGRPLARLPPGHGWLGQSSCPRTTGADDTRSTVVPTRCARFGSG